MSLVSQKGISLRFPLRYPPQMALKYSVVCILCTTYFYPAYRQLAAVNAHFKGIEADSSALTLLHLVTEFFFGMPIKFVDKVHTYLMRCTQTFSMLKLTVFQGYM